MRYHVDSNTMARSQGVRRHFIHRVNAGRHLTTKADIKLSIWMSYTIPARLYGIVSKSVDNARPKPPQVVTNNTEAIKSRGEEVTRKK